MAEKGPAARVAILGVPGAGKTTLFCAMAGLEYARIAAYPGRVHEAAVRVVDPRLRELHEKNGAQKKLVAPSVEFLDTPAIEIAEPGRQGNPSVLAKVREADGFAVVLRAYDLEGDRPQQVVSQLEAIRSELYLTDLDVVQKRLEKLRLETRKPVPNLEELKRELVVLERLSEQVAGGQGRAVLELTEEDEKKLRGFQFFSRKPIIPIVNVAETDLGQPPRPGPDALVASLRLEAELRGMEEAERAAFMKDYGLEELAIDRIPRDVFARMGFQTFVTLGDQDTTGWALRRGGTLWEAAGKIHTDIQKGFINGEVIGFEDFRPFRSFHEAAARGRARVQGRDHPLQDFDIIHIKTTAK